MYLLVFNLRRKNDLFIFLHLQFNNHGTTAKASRPTENVFISASMFCNQITQSIGSVWPVIFLGFTSPFKEKIGQTLVYKSS